jgi:threonylcarbamoyladenosine tRNA methylthiotransferase MtaB
MEKKVAFKTLGCRLNQSESDSLLSDFYKAGYEIVDFGDKADVYIINTCTVTGQSDHKSKYFINQACRRSNSPVVVVTGCMANHQREYLEKRNDITYIAENKIKSSILTLVDSHFKKGKTNTNDLKEDLFGFSPAEKSLHTRSFIKINDGCNNNCSYCIVPLVRGRAMSRPANSIIDNIRKVVELGYKEVVLTGVNISCYSYEETGFEDLVEKILNMQGDFRVRISSVEPESIGDKLTALFANPKLCPHLHLCLQSGSENILSKMRRVYTLPEYLKIIDRFKIKYPGINLTTDIIVGFPGETDKNFQDTCKVIKDIGFSHIHTFKFSVRRGTVAAHLPDQVPENIKNERGEIIRKISDVNKYNYRRSFINKTQRVLIERIIPEGLAGGYGEHYVPVRFKRAGCIKNTFADVKISGIDKKEDMVLTGEINL